MLRSNTWDFAIADIDRCVPGGSGLECKTTRIHGTGAHGYPDHYYVQCQHYMAVTGATVWYLAILNLSDGRFSWFAVQRNEEDIQSLMASEAYVWACVRDGVPPGTDGSPATGDAIDAIFGGNYGGADSPVPVDSGSLDEINAIRQEIDLLSKREAQLIQQLKLSMGDATSAAAGNWRISWKPQIRRTLDVKSLAQAYPSIDLQPFYKETKSRPFVISKGES